MESPTPAETLAAMLTELEHSMDFAVSVVYFDDDVIVVQPCTTCSTGEVVIGLRPLLGAGAGVCTNCASPLQMDSRASLERDDPLADSPWASWKWPQRESIALSTSAGFVHTYLGRRHD